MRRWLSILLVLEGFIYPCHGATMTQEKKLLMVLPGEKVEIHCQHEGTTISDNMYWYQQRLGEGLKLISMSIGMNDPTMEPEFDKTWNMSLPDNKKLLLTKDRAEAQDSAVYYCATSLRGGNERQYFGGGTVVSVLEDGKKKTAPKVKIFRPSRKELGDHNLLSLVCVASGFYPEHVRIKWFVDDIHRENLYHPEAQNDSKGFYSTYKRLTLTRAEYFNPETKFKCVAAFLDGSEEASEYIEGETDCGVSKVRFGMSITQGKISYIMVLCKSGVYGLIVLAVLWRKKVIADS